VATLAVCGLVLVGLYVLRERMNAESVQAVPPRVAPTLWQAPAAPSIRTTLFQQVHVVDVLTGALVRDQDVLVSDGRISTISDHVEPPAGALVIPSTGKYLMPGIIDTHVHVTADDQLFLFLAAGVTTVQGLGGPRVRNLEAEVRRTRGEIASPHYISCDTVIPGGAAASAAETVKSATQQGAECLKIYSPPDWTREEHAALMREALAANLRIGGHLPRNLPLEQGLGHGQQFVAHAEEFLYAHFNKMRPPRDPALIPAAVELARNGGVVVVPTLVAYNAIVEQVGPGITQLLARPELRHVALAVREQWQPANNRYRQRFTEADAVGLSGSFAYQQAFVRALDAAGVPLSVGTDASPQMPFVIPGFSAVEELRQLRRAGLPAAAVLRAATHGGAVLMRRTTEFGRVAAGLRADLILLDDNPLADVEHVTRRSGVMVAGRWMPERWLQERLPRY
jgi:hypothetical protein